MFKRSADVGDLSRNFSRSEFRDKHNGETHEIDPKLIVVLQRLRDRIGRPLPIVSGYRSPATNKLVGGATHSYHLVGKAADIPPSLVRPNEAKTAGAIGIGVCGGWVVHVDVRPGATPVIFTDCPRR